METPLEKVYDLLNRNAENVSANYWVNAIHEDKFEKLAEDIVKLFATPAVIKSVCGECLFYLTCNNESRDKQICDNYDNEP